VAPGFIVTEMTARMPFGTREIGSRINSLQQGGLPVDVAETIAWLSPAQRRGVNGQVVRVLRPVVPGGVMARTVLGSAPSMPALFARRR
jgi:NAD(P)-dependent dehydrogenase (short-subunit alcohol dehydrogenase family)